MPRKTLDSLSEPMFYVLMALQKQPLCGADIAQWVSARTEKPAKANVGAFLNSLTQSLQKIQSSGIPAVSERRETDSQIVLTITIPK